VVLEPRHPSWFENAAEDLLKERLISRVAADPACVPEASRAGGCADLKYFRLHGSPRLYYSAYSDQFLSRLALQFRSDLPGQQIWCILDNTASGAAIRNALDLKAKVANRVEV
jgi:uncharacterized protein YecE (DUF72 family)